MLCVSHRERWLRTNHKLHLASSHNSFASTSHHRASHWPTTSWIRNRGGSITTCHQPLSKKTEPIAGFFCGIQWYMNRVISMVANTVCKHEKSFISLNFIIENERHCSVVIVVGTWCISSLWSSLLPPMIVLPCNSYTLFFSLISSFF